MRGISWKIVQLNRKIIAASTLYLLLLLFSLVPPVEKYFSKNNLYRRKPLIEIKRKNHSEIVSEI